LTSIRKTDPNLIHPAAKIRILNGYFRLYSDLTGYFRLQTLLIGYYSLLFNLFLYISSEYSDVLGFETF